MGNFVLYVFVLQALARALYASADRSVSRSEPERPKFLQDFINASGGEEVFDGEIGKGLRHASSLCDGRQSVVEEYKRGRENVIIGRIRFDDDTSWAAKIFKSNRYVYFSVSHAINSLRAIEQYCPNIAVPRIYGDSVNMSNGSTYYYLMDWIEGKSLVDELSSVGPDLIDDGTNSSHYQLDVTIPEYVVRQLASFIYNLTTCPIPENESKKSLNSIC
jgi:hypothetical protein